MKYLLPTYTLVEACLDETNSINTIDTDIQVFISEESLCKCVRDTYQQYYGYDKEIRYISHVEEFIEWYNNWCVSNDVITKMSLHRCVFTPDADKLHEYEEEKY